MLRPSRIWQLSMTFRSSIETIWWKFNYCANGRHNRNGEDRAKWDAWKRMICIPWPQASVKNIVGRIKGMACNMIMKTATYEVKCTLKAKKKAHKAKNCGSRAKRTKIEDTRNVMIKIPKQMGGGNWYSSAKWILNIRCTRHGIHIWGCLNKSPPAQGQMIVGSQEIMNSTGFCTWNLFLLWRHEDESYSSGWASFPTLTKQFGFYFSSKEPGYWITVDGSYNKVQLKQMVLLHKEIDEIKMIDIDSRDGFYAVAMNVCTQGGRYCNSHELQGLEREDSPWVR